MLRDGLEFLVAEAADDTLTIGDIPLAIKDASRRHRATD
jgi:hypothetical protein